MASPSDIAWERLHQDGIVRETQLLQRFYNGDDSIISQRFHGKVHTVRYRDSNVFYEVQETSVKKAVGYKIKSVFIRHCVSNKAYTE